MDDRNGRLSVWIGNGDREKQAVLVVDVIEVLDSDFHVASSSFHRRVVTAQLFPGQLVDRDDQQDHH